MTDKWDEKAIEIMRTVIGYDIGPDSGMIATALRAAYNEGIEAARARQSAPSAVTTFHQYLNALEELLDNYDQEETLRHVRDAYCAAHGHRPERDQCNIPEHDFCLTCKCSLPGQAH